MKQFDTVEIHKPAKNVFNMSHDVKATYNFDKIYPFFCKPVYPGDTFNVSVEMFMRAMPMLAPVMHNVDAYIWFFECPDRIIFNENRKRDFKVWVTGGEDGKGGETDTLPPVALPTWSYPDVYAVNPDFCRHGSLMDHLGFPTIDSNETVQSSRDDRISSLPFRAYQEVYNAYFRNQNVQNEVDFSHDEGRENAASIAELFKFRKKCWEKDYFTSCLPWAQRGQAVSLPITLNDARLTGYLPISVGIAKVGNESVTRTLETGAGDSAILLSGAAPSIARQAIELQGSANLQTTIIRFTGLEVGTINDFRYCMRLQQWLENNARCGSRYIEQLLSHFGVVSSDARLQRPELLGGGKINLLFSDVEQTTKGNAEENNVLGNLGGKGTLYGQTHGFKKYFEEHGILLGVLAIIPRTSYSQGIPREWSLLDKTDWYFPEFAHLGEQAVLNKEIYFNPAEADDTDHPANGVFGYQGRFVELRYIPSTFHGEMRSDLSYWHFGQIFREVPVLNSDFVTAQTRANVFAITDIADGNYDPFVAQIHVECKAVRPLPKYAVPTL